MGSVPDSAVEALMQRLEQDPALRQRLEDGTHSHLTRPSPNVDHDLQQILIDLSDLPGPA